MHLHPQQGAFLMHGSLFPHPFGSCAGVISSILEGSMEFPWLGTLGGARDGSRAGRRPGQGWDSWNTQGNCQGGPADAGLAPIKKAPLGCFETSAMPLNSPISSFPAICYTQGMRAWSSALKAASPTPQSQISCLITMRELSCHILHLGQIHT